MRELIYEWRQQTGWVAPALACVLLSAWMRSRVGHDNAACCISSSQYPFSAFHCPGQPADNLSDSLRKLRYSLIAPAS